MKKKFISIEKIREDKNILSKQIEDLLYEFECKYGMNMIQSIQWIRHDGFNKGIGPIIQLEVNIKI